MDESDTERVLEQRLERLGGRVERGTRLLGFRVDGERSPRPPRDRGHEFETRFVVGADGAHSTVRHEAGIGFAGAAYPERFLLADLDLDWICLTTKGTSGSATMGWLPPSPCRASDGTG